MKSGKRKAVLDSLKKETYSKLEVVNYINQLGADMSIPDTLRMGDVFLDMVGVKKRPCVIFKVIKELGIVVYFPLSQTKNELNLCECNSRFHGKGFFQNQLLTATIAFAIDNFVGVFDNPKALRKAGKAHAEFYSQKVIKNEK